MFTNGRSERIRTSDPLIPNQVRYQAALRSDPMTPLLKYIEKQNGDCIATALRGSKLKYRMPIIFTNWV